MAEARKLGRVVIKEEFAVLLGDAISAMILNQFLYWTNILQKSYEASFEEWEKGLLKVKPIQRDGWIWKSAKELKEKELFNIASEKSIERRLNELVDRKILLRRNNPNKKADRTYQYKVNFPELQRQLQEIGFGLDGYKLNDDKPASESIRQIDECDKPASESIRQFDGGQNHQIDECREPAPQCVFQKIECCEPAPQCIRQFDGTIPETTIKTTETDREIGSQAHSLILSSEDEQEYLILDTLIEKFFPRENAKGNLNLVVLSRDIWRYWKTKHAELTIYHMYAVLDMVHQSPGFSKYDATSIICKQMGIAQALLVPVKEEAMNKVYALKQELQH